MKHVESGRAQSVENTFYVTYSITNHGPGSVSRAADNISEMPSS